MGVEYQIIAGERRFMAAKLLGLARVPAIVRNINLEREKLELGVIENIQRGKFESDRNRPRVPAIAGRISYDATRDSRKTWEEP